MKKKFYNVKGYLYSKEKNEKNSIEVLEQLFKNVVVVKTEMREEELAVDFSTAIYGGSIEEAENTFIKIIEGHDIDIDNYVFFE